MVDRKGPLPLENGFHDYNKITNGTVTPHIEIADDGDKQTKVALKKHVGLLSGTALIVGTMIGSGIFISPKGVLEGTGSVGLSLVIWLACGLLSTLGALAYAELGTAIPQSGGEHAYLMYTFGRGKTILGAIPAFLFDWIGLFLVRPTMFTLMAMSLGTYVVKPFFPECNEPPQFPVKIVTILAMLLLATVNMYSVKMATYLQNVTTCLKLLAIGIITVGGIYKLASGNTQYLMEGFEDTKEDLSLIAIAFYNGLWAYDGWNNLNFVTEELKNPEKNLPRCIMIGIPLTTMAYVLANIGYFAVMSKEEVLLSHAVAVTWSDYMLGVVWWLMPLFVVLSCLGSANGCLFASGRLCFAAARDKHFPSFLSFIQVNRLTPMPSILFTCIVAVILTLIGDLSTLIDFYGFIVWVVYGATTFSVIALRYMEPNLHRPYKTPIFVPIIVLVVSIYLVVAPIIQTGRTTFLYAVIFMFCGLVVYFPFIHWKLRFPYTGYIYSFLQKLMLVVPPSNNQRETPGT